MAEYAGAFGMRRSHKLTPQENEIIRVAYDSFSDEHGNITSKCMQAAFKKIGAENSIKDIQMLIDDMDEDGNGVVTQQEMQMFFNGQNPKHHEIRSSLPRKTFDQYEFYHLLNAGSQQKGDASIFTPTKPQRSSSRRGVMDMILDGFCCTTCPMGYVDNSNDIRRSIRL